MKGRIEGIMTLEGVPMNKRAIAHIILCFFAMTYGKKYSSDKHCVHLKGLFDSGDYDAMFRYYKVWHKDYVNEQQKIRAYRETRV